MIRARKRKSKSEYAVALGRVSIRGLNIATPRNAKFWSQILSSCFGHFRPRFLILLLLVIISFLQAESKLS
jgi:hypothetical protein